MLSWIEIYNNEELEFTFKDIFFGKFDLDKDFMLINHILLLAKLFIYSCKIDKIVPSFVIFKAKLKANYNLEFFIARKNGTLLKHFIKWDSFSSIFFPFITSNSFYPVIHIFKVKITTFKLDLE